MAEPVPIFSRITFCFEIPRISKLDSVSSPVFMVQGIPWFIKVYKKNVETKQFLGIFLHYAKEDKPPHSKHAAWASFKLLKFNDNQNAIEKHIVPHVFDHTKIGYGFFNFIEWDNLFDVKNNFVKDDTINFDIKMEAEPQNQMNKSELKYENISCNCQTKFRITVSNINHLIAVQSDKFKLQDMPWDLTVYKDQFSNLGVRLNRKVSPIQTPCKTEMTVKLLSKRSDVETIVQTQIGNNFPPNTCAQSVIQTKELLSWDELFKPENGFVENDSITLEVQMKGVMTSGASDSEDGVKRRKLQCLICSGNIDSQHVSCPPCGHVFCTPCIENTVKVRKICPSCNAVVTLDGLRSVHMPFMN